MAGLSNSDIERNPYIESRRHRNEPTFQEPALELRDRAIRTYSQRTRDALVLMSRVR